MDFFEIFEEEQLTIQEMQVIRLLAYVYANFYMQGLEKWDVSTVIEYCKQQRMTPQQHHVFLQLFSTIELMVETNHTEWMNLANPINYFYTKSISCSFEEPSNLIFQWCCLSFYSTCDSVTFQPLFCISGFTDACSSIFQFLGQCLSSRIESLQIIGTVLTEDDIVNFIYASVNPQGCVVNFKFDKEIQDLDNMETISTKIISITAM